MRRPSTPHATELDILVGRRIRLARNLSKITQAKLAAAMGVSFQQIQKYEKGINCVCVSRLWELSRILRVPLTYFFADVIKPKNEQISSENVLLQTETLELVGNYYRINNRILAKQIFDIIKTAAQSDINKIKEIN